MNASPPFNKEYRKNSWQSAYDDYKNSFLCKYKQKEVELSKKNVLTHYLFVLFFLSYLKQRTKTNLLRNISILQWEELYIYI